MFPFAFPEPVSAEEAIKTRKRNEARVKEALPIIIEIRAKLRELASIGHDTVSVRKCRKRMAVLQEHLETFLVRDPALDLPEPEPKREERAAGSGE